MLLTRQLVCCCCCMVLGGVDENRRITILSSIFAGPAVTASSASASASGPTTTLDNSATSSHSSATASHVRQVTLPLERSTGGTNAIRLNIFGLPQEDERKAGDVTTSTTKTPTRLYRVIVDTGSPYLVLPSYGINQPQPATRPAEQSIISVNSDDEKEEEEKFFSRFVPYESILTATTTTTTAITNNDSMTTTTTASTNLPSSGLESTTPASSVSKRRNFGNTILNNLLFVSKNNNNDTTTSSTIPFQLNSAMDEFPPTDEIYGSQLGQIIWNKCPSVQFRNSRIVVQPQQQQTQTSSSQFQSSSLVIGVLDRNLTKESGGPLLGLIKNSNAASEKVQLRPTLFSQIGLTADANNNDDELESDPIDKDSSRAWEISSFQIDSPNRQLTFFAKSPVKKSGPFSSLIKSDANDVLQLIDLRPLGDFVEHYACNVHKLILNSGGEDIIITSEILDKERLGLEKKTSKTLKPRPIIAVFDTGLTGCLFTQPLWDALILNTNISDPSNLTSVDVRIPSFRDNDRTLKEEKENFYSIESNKGTNPFFYVAPISLDWFDDEETAPHVVILGQTFLSQGTLTIDIDDRRALFQKS